MSHDGGSSDAVRSSIEGLVSILVDSLPLVSVFNSPSWSPVSRGFSLAFLNLLND